MFKGIFCSNQINTQVPSFILNLFLLLTYITVSISYPPKLTLP
jgi:hypothetical protein